MALPVTSELVERTAASLRDGGWRFTPRQLYYAVCAAAETPPSRSPANGLMGLGAVLALVAIILLHVPIAFIALLIAGGLFFVMGVVARLTHRPLSGRLLAVSFAEFERLVAAAPLDGLIDVASWRPAAAGAVGVTVVCDTLESAAAIDANRLNSQLTDVVVRHASPDIGLRGARAIAVHDASPRGCALPLELRDGGAEVLDAGLRARWVDGGGFQELEGAPARLPRDLSAVCSDSEIGWLASGRRVELAVLPPPRLARLVQAALDYWKGHPDASISDAPGLLPSLPDLPND